MAAARKTRQQLASENEELRARLAEAEETLRAIREGEVDAIVVSGPGGERVFSLTGAEQVYRLIAETMSEAALTVAVDGTVLFANAQLGQLLRRPLEQIVGRPLRDFVHPDYRAAGDALLVIAKSQRVRQRLVFQAADGTGVPTHVASSILDQPAGRSICLAVGDLTELENSTELVQQLRSQQEELRKSRAASLNLVEDAIEARQEAERASLALRESEDRIQQALHVSRSFTFEWQPATDTVLRSESCADILGLSGDASVHGTAQHFLQHIHPEDRDRFVQMLGRLAPGSDSYLTQYRVMRGDGAEAVLEETGRATFDSQGKLLRLVGVSTDVTGRKQREGRIARLSKLYAVLSRVNEAIVRIGEEQALYREVCRIVAEEGGFPLVWVGEVRDGQVAPVAWAGPAAGYLKEIRVEVDGELGRGPTGTCIREGRSVVNFDFKANPSMAPWRTPADRHGLRSSSAFPLRRGGVVVGALTFYAPEPGGFDAEHIRLLEALAADLSYALDAMREERLRTEAEEALRAAHGQAVTDRNRLAAVMEALPVGVAIVDAQGGNIQANAAFEQVWGAVRSARGVSDYVAYHAWWPDTGEPVQPEEWASAIAVQRGEAVVGQEMQIQRADGTRAWVLNSGAPILDAQGQVVGAAVAIQDITPLKRAEEALRRARDELELRVRERTAELAETVAQLKAEMAARERAARLAEATARLLRLFAEKASEKDYLDATVALLHEWSGCRCVGIRVLHGDGGLPYQAHVGFSPEFMAEEMVLDTRRDCCVCVRVATGTPEPQDRPAITPGGSFACVDAPSFVAGLTAAEAARYRGVCMRVGFRTLVVVPVRYRGRTLGAIHLADELPGALSAEEVEFLESRSLLIGEALHRFDLEQQVMAISEEERRQVGQELHDGVGQQLTGIAYMLDNLEAVLAERHAAETRRVADLRKAVGEVDAHVRSVSRGLYPSQVASGGLSGALEDLARRVTARYSIACSCECAASVALERGAATQLHRIAQEAVNNAVKHGRPRVIRIRLGESGGQVMLSIHDDGAGLPHDLAGSPGLGMQIMAYRASAIGGTLSVQPAAEGGTVVSCFLPARPGASKERTL